MSALPTLTADVIARGRQLVAAAPTSAAMAELEREAIEREVRRLARIPSGRAPHTLRCSACHRFVRSLSAPCACGWDPHGGWGS